jgi:RNA-directed DNA polymerase
LINPVLRGWVNYFAVGHSSECFNFINAWRSSDQRRQRSASSRFRCPFGRHLSAGDASPTKAHGQ